MLQSAHSMRCIRLEIACVYLLVRNRYCRIESQGWNVRIMYATRGLGAGLPRGSLKRPIRYPTRRSSVHKSGFVSNQKSLISEMSLCTSSVSTPSSFPIALAYKIGYIAINCQNVTLILSAVLNYLPQPSPRIVSQQ